LQELYQSKGYVDVEISQPRIDRQDGKVTIVFPIKEGLQYHVGKVNYVGAQVFTQDEISKSAKNKSRAKSIRRRTSAQTLR
jgi:outer membrane protein assembly factor BamA